MFTGIIEDLATVVERKESGGNLDFTLQSSIATGLKIDQSVAHDGVCLTVVAIQDDRYSVTAVAETLRRSNLQAWKKGSLVNLERAMPANGRLDGHLVQGHVDSKGTCVSIEDMDGSWLIRFAFQASPGHLLVDKGSICVNGVSLTVVEPTRDSFSVAIIPYTFEHTNFKSLRAGDQVNLEFDIIGKYIARHLELYGPDKEGL